jgi:hypothetical protein
MSKLKFDLLPGETVIDTWTLFYFPPDSKDKWNGKCTITNRRIFYEVIMDASLGAALTKVAVAEIGGKTLSSAKGFQVIEKSSIVDVEIKKSFLSNKVALTLDDGSVHVFGYGAMGINKVVDAINAR